MVLVIFTIWVQTGKQDLAMHTVALCHLFNNSMFERSWPLLSGFSISKTTWPYPMFVRLEPKHWKFFNVLHPGQHHFLDVATMPAWINIVPILNTFS